MESGPVFADSSGRRHRVFRYVGLGTAAVLAVCLVAVVVAMTGGPQAPFTHWAVQQPPFARPGNASQQAAGHADRGDRTGSAGQAGGQNQNGGASGTAAPGASGSPSPGSSPSASPAATSSAGPTNPAGKTPPGHSKSPNPHRSNVA